MNNADESKKMEERVTIHKSPLSIQNWDRVWRKFKAVPRDKD